MTSSVDGFGWPSHPDPQFYIAEATFSKSAGRSHIADIQVQRSSFLDIARPSSIAFEFLLPPVATLRGLISDGTSIESFKDMAPLTCGK